jgi:O-antigen ligase
MPSNAPSDAGLGAPSPARGAAAPVAFEPFAMPALRPALRAALAVVVGLLAPSIILGRSPATILIGVAAGIALTLVALPRRAADYRRWLADPLVVVLAAAFLSWLASATLVTIHPGFSLWLWAATLLTLLAGVVIRAALAPAPAAWTLALRVLVAAAIAVGAFGVVALVALPEAIGWIRPRPVRTALDAEVALKGFANVMPCLAPLLVLAAFRLRGAWRALALLALALGAGIVLGTGSRAALAGYAGAALAVVAVRFVLALAPRWRVAALLAALALAVAGAVIVVERLPKGEFAGPETLRLPASVVDGHRQVIWGFVVERGAERPLLGWGPGTSGRMPGAKRMVPHYNQQYVPAHPHNWLIQLFGETGLVGLGLALLALGLYVVGLARRADRHPGGGGAMAALALAGAFFVSNLANFSIWNVWWQAMFFGLTALALATPPRPSPAARP